MLCALSDGSPTLSKTEKAIQYHLRSGGGRIRALLTAQAALALGLSKDDAISLATIPELLHNASLIHDDLQDGDQYRRGQEAVWFKYSPAVAICAGDYLISLAFKTLGSLSNGDKIATLLEVIHRNISHLVNGQIDDLEFETDQINTMTLKTKYRRTVERKSAPLLSICLALPLIVAEHDQTVIANAHKATVSYALAYQIFDDMKDFQTDLERGDRQILQNYGLILKELGEKEPVNRSRRDALDAISNAIEASGALPAELAGVFMQHIVTLQQKIKKF